EGLDGAARGAKEPRQRAPYARIVVDDEHGLAGNRRAVRHGEPAVAANYAAADAVRQTLSAAFSDAACSPEPPASGASCRMTTQVAPRSGLRSAQIRPRLASTIVLQTARPMPMPEDLVVQNASNTFSSASTGIPAPESRTSRRATPPPGRDTEMRSLRSCAG